jgi:uncharacterized protein DUF4189
LTKPFIEKQTMRDRSWLGCALCLTFVAAGAIRADDADRYAAFAYNSNTGESWFAFGLESKEKAESTVVKHAKDRNNLTVVTFKNCYCSLAMAADGKTFGVGSGEGPLAAQEAALKDCRKKSFTKCSIVVTLHTAQGIGGDSYFAIAFSTSTGRYGVAVAKASKSEAETEAIDHCKAADAKVVAVTKNGCLALALGKNKSVYGVGVADSEKEAQEMALEACKKKTTDCAIAVTLAGKK